MIRTLLFVVVLGVTCLGRSWAASPDEQYFVVMLGDERAGWMVERQTTTEDRITTSAAMRFEVGRGAATVKIEVETEFVETTDHRPISMRSRQSIAAVPVETRYEFFGETVTITSTQQGRESSRTVDAPTQPWVTPGRAAAIVRDSLSAGASIPDITILDPTFGLTPIVTSRTPLEETTVEVVGRTVPGYRTMTSLSAMPGPPSEEFIGLDGRLLRSTTTLGGISITMLEAEKEIALADIDPPEIMQSTFIRPNRVIDDPRGTRRATYILSVPDAELGALPSSPRHRIEAIDERTARLVIDLEAAPDAAAPPSPQEMGSSTMLSIDDQAVASLVRRAGASKTADAAVRAEALRRFVHGYISGKSLDVGFATASEVARTRVGDCTEHAVLLAALLRADGIPSRVVSGLIYATDFIGAEDIFGYHMWTQAWVENGDGVKGWVDLDATLPADTPFDATHIALEISNLADGESINSMLRLSPLIGRLQVAVESVRP
ncbi:MAG: transglutaminase-like domain-containing protein [Phycisphaerales bacterium]